jgi:hypothetical protein
MLFGMAGCGEKSSPHLRFGNSGQYVGPIARIDMKKLKRKWHMKNCFFSLNPLDPLQTPIEFTNIPKAQVPIF